MASTWNMNQTWSMKESLCMNQVIRNVHQSMRKVEIDGIKVDYYDAKNKVIHEIKKSNKVDKAHEWQLKYYMYVFEQHGIDGVKGILEYPLLRKTKEVILTDVDRDDIQVISKDIIKIISQDVCPSKVKKGICKNCSYFDFCYINELEEEE